MRHLHQVLIGASSGDAISGMAFATQRWLQSRYNSTVYAALPDPSIYGRVWSTKHIDRDPNDAPVIYHASYGLDSVRKVIEQREGPIVLMYHNVTPAEYFRQIDPEFAVGLDKARDELRELRDRFTLVLAASHFSAHELREYGYRDVHVLPIGLDVKKLTRFPRQVDLQLGLRDKFPRGYVIAIAQLLPHKALEDVITAVSLVRTVHHERVGLVIVGTPRSGIYSRSLEALADRLLAGNVHFTGPISDSQLATYFSEARCYVSTSRHEGLGIPLLEAMALGVPAVVRDAGAVKETAGGAAVVLPGDARATGIAAAVADVLKNFDLARDLREKGRIRAEHFALTPIMTRFDQLLDKAGI